MMDEGLIIETDGRVVGVAVRVRGGFMFFSSDPDLKILEATVFRRVEMITQRVTEILQYGGSSKEQTSIGIPPSYSPSIDGGGNVVRLHPRRCRTTIDPEPPDAA